MAILVDVLRGLSGLKFFPPKQNLFPFRFISHILCMALITIVVFTCRCNGHQHIIQFSIDLIFEALRCCVIKFLTDFAE
jgi:hypothetical protein